MAATTARIDPTTEAAPLTAQAHATRPSLRVPAEAMTVGKTVPRGTPIAVATRHAAAARARSGHARVPGRDAVKREERHRHDDGTRERRTGNAQSAAG